MFEHKISHKKYIGQSINITKRKWEHLTYPSPYSKFDEVLLKEGEDAFNFIILEECPASQLDERETYWIEYYDSINNGYNLIKGGNCYRGENNIAAKLTDKQVLEIINLLINTNETFQSIAEKYSVSYNTIDLINRCKTWCHLHNYTNNIRNTAIKISNPALSSHSGEHSHSSKITEQQAIEIIKLLKNDSRSLAQLSRDLDISLNILYDINRCRTWKYLHNYSKNIRNEARKEVMLV